MLRRLAGRQRFEHTIELKVPFYDIDPTLIVWHGNYYKYFDDARRALYEAHGCTTELIKSCGVILPIIDTHLTYRRPLRFADQIKVRAYLIEWETRLKVGFEISRDLELCAYGYTVQAAVEPQTMQLQLVLPQAIQDCFA